MCRLSTKGFLFNNIIIYFFIFLIAESSSCEYVTRNIRSLLFFFHKRGSFGYGFSRMALI